MGKDRGTVRIGNREVSFAVVRSRRRTVQIVVTPHGAVTVRVPLGTPFADVEAFVVRKGPWIARKVAVFRERALAHPAPAYCDGERHLFLGLGYPLRIASGTRRSVALRDGELFVTTRGNPSPEAVQEALRTWYAHQAQQVFQESFDRCWPLFEAFGREAPSLRWRFMTSRWGSWSARGAITMNTHLVKAGLSLTDYVMTHELCHMVHPNHWPDFKTLLGTVLPEWRERRKQLNGLSIIR